MSIPNPSNSTFSSVSSAPASDSTALGHYFADIRKFPVLDREAEIELTLAVKQGHPGAFDRLIECNLRFVVKIAREHLGSGLPLEDLINEGNLGLIEAAQRFDPDRGVRFITFAVWWVRRAIRTALTNQTHSVRLPGSQLKRMREARVAADALRAELGREPSQSEVAERLPANLAGADPILYHGIRMHHLDAPTPDGGSSSLTETLEDQSLSAEDTVLRDERIARIREACKTLDERQKAVVTARFGLDNDTPVTLDEAGRLVGRSRERVRQIEGQALRSLRFRVMAASRPCVPSPRVGRRHTQAASAS